MIYKSRKILSIFSFVQLPTLTGLLSPFEWLGIATVAMNLNNFRIRKEQFVLLLMIISLFIAHLSQAIFLDLDVVFLWFAIKYASIILCFFIYILFSNVSSDYSVAYVKAPLILSVVFALFVAPSYMLNYTPLLPPGICERNNLHFLTGHLRCGSFGEGNYFGLYLMIIAIAFHRFRHIYFLCLVGIFISSSTIALFVIIYLGLRFLFGVPFYVMATVGLLVISYIIFNQDILEMLVTGKGLPQRTSFGERLEFIRIGFRIFLDHPIVGVGAGQYGKYVGDYTDFPHLIEGSKYLDIRFISNNVIVEFLSEFGVIGFLMYLCVIYALTSKLSHLNKFTKLENLMLLLLMSTAQPTFFILSNMLIFGLIVAKGSNRNV